jgi:hypothetical protein
LSASWAAVILGLSVIVVFSLRRSFEQTDDHEPRGGRGPSDPAALLHHAPPDATVAGLAFVVSFEAISAFAVTTGAFPPALGWCAPMLVDTFRIVCLTRGAEGFDFLVLQPDFVISLVKV